MSDQRVRWSDLGDGPHVEPSVYAADLMVLGEQIDTLLEAGVRAFHVDVGDGRFIAPIILGEVVVEAVAERVRPHGALVDCHMMVADPERHIDLIADAGGDSFTFHVEATDDVQGTLDAVRASGMQVGVAANPDTPVDTLFDPAARADLALCMGVHPGLSGQAFIPETVDRVGALRRGLPASVRIQVDGGVDAHNVADLHAAGADLFVAGSAIFWSGDPAGGYRTVCSRLPFVPREAHRP